MLFVSIFLKSAAIIFAFVIAGESIYALYYHNRKNRFDE